MLWLFFQLRKKTSPFLNKYYFLSILRERKKQTKDTDRHRKTERQKDRKTERQKDRKTERQKDRKTDR